MTVESYKATLVELQNKNMELEKSILKKKKKNRMMAVTGYIKYKFI